MMKRMLGFLSAACVGAQTQTASPKARVSSISFGIGFMLLFCVLGLRRVASAHQSPSVSFQSVSWFVFFGLFGFFN
jgi:uncharacterized membrane protein